MADQLINWRRTSLHDGKAGRPGKFIGLVGAVTLQTSRAPELAHQVVMTQTVGADSIRASMTREQAFLWRLSTRTSTCFEL
jgi:hypothetical protein